MLRQLLDDLRRHDSAFWRRAVRAGVVYGPEAFVRYSPPVFGLAFAAALPKHRRAVQRNLRLALGPRGPIDEAASVARVFTTYASCLTEAFVAGNGRGERVKGRVVNDFHFLGAEREGRGVVLATAHVGGWQVAGTVLQGGHDVDLVVVMRRERDARAQALSDEARDRAGVKVAYMGDDPLDALPLLAHLRKGGVVAVQVDRVPPGMRGRPVSLFGAPWTIPEGPLRLASLSGAPIVPAFARRLGYMEYEVELGAPIRLPRRPSEEDLDDAARAVAGAVERFVRENPTQWFHFE